MGSAMISHTIGNILILVALLLLVVSFATNEWVVKRVDRDKITSTSTSPEYYTRRLGLFRECYAQDNSDISFLLTSANTAIKDDTVDSKLGCLLIEYLIPEVDRKIGSYSENFITKVHLMRACVAMLIVSMVFILVSMIIGFTSCWKSFIDSKWTNAAKWTGIVLFIAAFFNAFGIALWHGAEYLEKYKIDDDYRGSKYFDSTWDSEVKNATDRFYSYSYYLGWVAVFLEVVAALVFYLTGWMHRPAPEKRPVFNDYPTLSSAGYRNRAYDYVENRGPYAIQDASYSMPDDYYYVSNPRNQRYQQYAPGQDYGPKGYDSDQGWRWDRY